MKTAPMLFLSLFSPPERHTMHLLALTMIQHHLFRYILKSQRFVRTGKKNQKTQTNRWLLIKFHFNCVNGLRLPVLTLISKVLCSLKPTYFAIFCLSFLSKASWITANKNPSNSLKLLQHSKN